MKLIGSITKKIINLPSWRTNRKIVVIESDDWGSIRMPSKQIYSFLIKKGIKVDGLCYNKYDSLASETDLSMLFDVLSSVKDKNNCSAIITANTIVGNPDFDKIKESDFNEYHFEPFTKTLSRYPEHAKSFDLWQQGMNSGVFHPQLHGREHINVTRWMNALKNNSGNARFAFELGMYDLSDGIKITGDSYMDTFNLKHFSELAFQLKSVSEGAELFECLFGYKSKTFIAPCYKWSTALNSTFKENGVECFQGNWVQLEPQVGEQHKFRKIFHYTGQQNSINQRYLVRNVQFEPSQNPNFDYVNDALQKIQQLFIYKKPAIICSHRLNFIGFIDPNNRERNLLLFAQLLNEITKRWPDVEFMSSNQLYELISNDEKK
jgi:hypothetical protein